MTPRVDAGSLYGTVNLLVLQALAAGPLHGLGVARRIQAATEDELQLDEGALYPALHRLAERGFLEASWGQSENNRRARFYTLTPRGRAELERETERWLRHAGAMERILLSDPHGKEGLAGP